MMLDEFQEDYYDSDDLEELFSGDAYYRNDIAGFYADEDQIESLCSHDSYSLDEIQDILKDYLRFFSLEEKDIIYMGLVMGKTQEDISYFFDKTQPAVFSDYRRLKKQIGFVVKVKEKYDEILDLLISDKLKISELDRILLVVFMNTTSITKTAQLVGIQNMICRERLFRAIEKLKSSDAKKPPEIYFYFKYIVENMNRVKKELNEAAIVAEKKKVGNDGMIVQEFDFQ